MPKKIVLEIRERVYRVLDEKDYMGTQRQRSSVIMDALVADPNIGGKIAEYYGKERVRTYIKDSVLNRYTKDRTKPPVDWAPFFRDLFGLESTRIATSNGVRVYRSDEGVVIVASHGRLLKWETALRKLLEYRAANIVALARFGNTIESCLILMSGGATQTTADLNLLITALGNVNVKVKVV